jgi:lysozyme family protein
VKTLIAVGVVLVVVIAAATLPRGNPTGRPPTSEPPARTADEATQAVRLSFLQSHPEWFAKLDGRATSRLWVRPAFHALEFADKTRFVNVAFLYSFAVHPDDTPKDGRQMTLIYDAVSGKLAGKYGPAVGGLRME